MINIKIKIDNHELELNGSEEFLKSESAKFYNSIDTNNNAYIASLVDKPCAVDKKETSDCGVDLHYTLVEHFNSWEDIISEVKKGFLELDVGDTFACKLKDGRNVDFVVTNVDNDVIRFESLDCLGEKVKHTELDGYYNRAYNLLPDVLQAAIVPMERKWLDKDGNLKIGTYKLFAPSCSEIAPEDKCIGDKGIYKQLDWYKDRRHCIRCDEKGGNICCWWTASEYSSDSTSFVYVPFSGNVNYFYASSMIDVPICFCIKK